MNRRLVGIGLAAILALFLVWFFALRGKDSETKKVSSGLGSGAGFTKPVARGSAAPEPDVPVDTTTWYPDPVGGMSLEGQVLDDKDQPVKDAEVTLSSSPERKTTTREDGVFVFDKLVGRQYSVSARLDDFYGGPVRQQLNENSPPVIIRLVRGATLKVKVVAESTPLAGAEVKLLGKADQTGKTGADGVATFKGVPPGWHGMLATADGYAPAESGTLISTGAPTVEYTIELRKGAAVSGRVVDEAGAPVANARVAPQDAGRAWDSGGLGALAVTTTETGEFRFAALPQGSYRFIARHQTLAAGTSAPVSLDGTSEVKELEIVMKKGAAITGTVVMKDGAPAPYAQVGLAPEDVMDFVNWGGAMTITADAKGAFALRGLPRKKFRIRAESDAVASAITDVDLTEVETQEVKLVLDVSGMIAGIVVDSAGQPVPEVQVVAIADFWDDTKTFALAGFATATTDGGGAFAIHGLVDGRYSVSPHRYGLAPQDSFNGAKGGAKAKTGDTNVKLVLPSPGTIKGKVATASGDPPSFARVQIGWQRNAVVVDGEFTLADVEPGDWDVIVRGPEFADKTVRDVVVKPAKTTDVGTIKVERGRKISGKVLDGKGAPVAGVTVRVGRMIFSEGGKAGAQDENLDALAGNRVATSGADGGFAIVGVSKEGGTIAADHATLGRSDALPVAAGTADVTDLQLVLHGFGSISGKVTMKGQPVAATVMAAPVSGGAQFVSVQAGVDGAYVIDKVSEGPQRLTAMQLGMASMTSSDSVLVEVKAGQRIVQNIEIPAGDITVVLALKPKAGATVDSAQVFLFRGIVAVKNGKDLTEAFTKGGASGGGMKFWMGSGDLQFEEVVPGKISLCSIPITGDISDPKVVQRLQTHGDKLDVYCMAADIAAAPKTQSFTQELPSMRPLPED
jgi:uncharacterized GH25 family protein